MSQSLTQLGALQLALLKAGLVLRSQLTSVEAEASDNRYDGIEQCRKNVIRCNRSKKLSYCLKQEEA